ncbi:tetratricopeptide repeat protein [Candidatus Dependentiae bacterium]
MKRPYAFLSLFIFAHMCIKTSSTTLSQTFTEANNLLINKKYTQAIELYKKIIALKPDVPGLYFNAGYACKLAKNYPDAIAYLSRVVEIKPNWTKAYSLLGEIYLAIDECELALKHLYKAIKLNPQSENDHINFASTLIRQKNYPEAEKYLKKFVKKFPKNTILTYNLAYILRIQGKEKEAIPYYLQALETDPSFDTARLGIAKAYLATGQLKKGWNYFEYRFQNNKISHKKFDHHTLVPADLTNKTVLLKYEWGLGDMMQFIRYAKLIKSYGATILVSIQKPLQKLFSLCPYIDKIVNVGDRVPKIDYKIPILSLPLLFNTTLETIPANIPYLYADEKLISLWRNKLSHNKNFKVGICWHAKPIFLENNYLTRRTVPLKDFEPLANIKNTTLYSLQKIYGLEELDNLPDNFNIATFGPDFDETNGRFMDTAALIENLDLVITADTSIVHIAGALGKPVWILVPYVAEWRWLQKSNRTPWYPKARLFRQKQPSDWTHVIKEVTKELEKHINNNPQK